MASWSTQTKKQNKKTRVITMGTMASWSTQAKQKNKTKQGLLRWGPWPPGAQRLKKTTNLQKFKLQ